MTRHTRSGIVQTGKVYRRYTTTTNFFRRGPAKMGRKKRWYHWGSIYRMAPVTMKVRDS